MSETIIRLTRKSLHTRLSEAAAELGWVLIPGHTKDGPLTYNVYDALTRKTHGIFSPGQLADLIVDSGGTIPPADVP